MIMKLKTKNIDNILFLFSLSLYLIASIITLSTIEIGRYFTGANSLRRGGRDVSRRSIGHDGAGHSSFGCGDMFASTTPAFAAKYTRFCRSFGR